jgi:hypothetical protein
MAIPSSCSSLPDSQLVNTPAAVLDRCRSVRGDRDERWLQRALSMRRRKADADHAENHSMPVVRFAGRGSRGVLRLAWQVVPTILPELLKDHESPTAQRAMEAMIRMKKIDIRELEQAVAREQVTR